MKLFPISFLFGLLVSTASAQTFQGSGEAKFLALAKPSMLNVNGHSGKLTGQLELSATEAKGKFEVDTKTFKTDMEVRDKHLRDKVLKPTDHPKATLDLLPVALPKDWKKGQALNSKFKGNLTLVGVTKPVEGDLKVEGTNMKTEAVFKIKLSDFGIEAPKYMGLKVENEVTVRALIPAFKAP